MKSCKHSTASNKQHSSHDVYASEEDIRRTLNSGPSDTVLSMGDKIINREKITYKDLFNFLMDGVKEFKEMKKKLREVEKEKDKIWWERQDLYHENFKLQDEIMHLEFGDASLQAPAEVEAVYLADNIIQFPETRRATNAN